MKKVLTAGLQAGGVSYYRHIMPAKWMNKLGIADVTYFEDEYGFFHAIGELGGVEKWLLGNGGKFDIVHAGYSTVVEHVQAFATLRAMAQDRDRKDQRLVTDLDDDINNVPVYNTAWRHYQGDSQKKATVKMQLRLSDGVSVTREELASSIRADCNEVGVLGNYVDTEDWDNKIERVADSDVRILLTGNLGRKGDFDQIQTVLEGLVGKYDGSGGKPYVKLLFMGCTPDWAAPWLDNRKDPRANRAYYIQPCHFKLYPRILQTLQPDILLAPVDPNPFNSSKTFIKAFDSAMTGAAFACTDWATYDEVPNDACVKSWSQIQWRESLEELVENAELRGKLAGRLREWAVGKWDIRNHVHKWGEFYDLISQRPAIKSNELSGIVRPRIVKVGGGK